MKKEVKIVICGPRRSLTVTEMANGWTSEEVKCAECGAELMHRPDPEIGDEARFMCLGCALPTISRDAEFRMTKQNKETVLQLGANPDAMIRTVENVLKEMAEEERPSLQLRLLRAWWRFQIKLARIWWASDLAMVATACDSEFMSTIDKWRGHPSYYVRVMCSRRWIRITWPNDPVSAHEEDARIMWEKKNG